MVPFIFYNKYYIEPSLIEKILKGSYINFLVVLIPCLYMIFLDGVSIIGLKTNLIDKGAQLSLVRDRKSKLDLSCWMNVNDFMDLSIT